MWWFGLFKVVKVKPVRPGVNIHFFESIAAECGGRIHAATSGRILSPGYPAPYDNNLHCTWVVEADPGKTIRYLFYWVSVI